MIFQNKMQQFVDNASKKKRLAEQLARTRRSAYDISVWLQWQQYAVLEFATDKALIRIAKSLNRIEKLLNRIHKHMAGSTEHGEPS